jgi:hypothetical protein
MTSTCAALSLSQASALRDSALSAAPSSSAQMSSDDGYEASPVAEDQSDSGPESEFGRHGGRGRGRGRGRGQGRGRGRGSRGGHSAASIASGSATASGASATVTGDPSVTCMPEIGAAALDKPVSYGHWTPRFRIVVLTAVGYASLVKRSMSTYDVWKNNDPGLFMWYRRLYSGSDAGQIKSLAHPFSESAHFNSSPPSRSFQHCSMRFYCRGCVHVSSAVSPNRHAAIHEQCDWKRL